MRPRAPKSGRRVFPTSKGVFIADPEDVLGRGTYGVVYRVRHEKDASIKKAVKTFCPETMDESEGIPSTTLREINALKTINHPNVMTAEEVVIPTEQSLTDMFVVMELCKGTLKDKIIEMIQGLLGSNHAYIKPEPGMRLPPEYIKEAKIVAWQLLNSLAVVHSRGIMHRDLKPVNIMWGFDGLLKLGDFGLARFVRGNQNSNYNVVQQTGEVQTMWYRAPEVLLGDDKYGLLVDDWSIGCVIAELFRFRRSSSGRMEPDPLFHGRSDVETLMIVFETIGTPQPSKCEASKYLAELPYWSSQFPRWFDGTLRSRVQLIDDDGYDLLTQLLKISPSERRAARFLLDHKWFDDVRGDLHQFVPWYRGFEKDYVRLAGIDRLPPARLIKDVDAAATAAAAATAKKCSNDSTAIARAEGSDRGNDEEKKASGATETRKLYAKSGGPVASGEAAAANARGPGYRNRSKPAASCKGGPLDHHESSRAVPGATDSSTLSNVRDTRENEAPTQVQLPIGVSSGTGPVAAARPLHSTASNAAATAAMGTRISSVPPGATVITKATAGCPIVNGLRKGTRKVKVATKESCVVEKTITSNGESCVVSRLNDCSDSTTTTTSTHHEQESNHGSLELTTTHSGGTTSDGVVRPGLHHHSQPEKGFLEADAQFRAAMRRQDSREGASGAEGPAVTTNGHDASDVCYYNRMPPSRQIVQGQQAPSMAREAAAALGSQDASCASTGVYQEFEDPSLHKLGGITRRAAGGIDLARTACFGQASEQSRGCCVTRLVGAAKLGSQPRCLETQPARALRPSGEEQQLEDEAEVDVKMMSAPKFCDDLYAGRAHNAQNNTSAFGNNTQQPPSCVQDAGMADDSSRCVLEVAGNSDVGVARTAANHVNGTDMGPSSTSIGSNKRSNPCIRRDEDTLGAASRTKRPALAQNLLNGLRLGETVSDNAGAPGGPVTTDSPRQHWLDHQQRAGPSAAKDSRDASIREPQPASVASVGSGCGPRRTGVGRGKEGGASGPSGATIPCDNDPLSRMTREPGFHHAPVGRAVFSSIDLDGGAKLAPPPSASGSPPAEPSRIFGQPRPGGSRRRLIPSVSSGEYAADSTGVPVDGLPLNPTRRRRIGGTTTDAMSQRSLLANPVAQQTTANFTVTGNLADASAGIRTRNVARMDVGGAADGAAPATRDGTAPSEARNWDTGECEGEVSGAALRAPFQAVGRRGRGGSATTSSRNPASNDTVANPIMGGPTTEAAAGARIATGAAVSSTDPAPVTTLRRRPVAGPARRAATGGTVGSRRLGASSGIVLAEAQLIRPTSYQQVVVAQSRPAGNCSAAGTSIPNATSLPCSS